MKRVSDVIVVGAGFAGIYLIHQFLNCNFLDALLLHQSCKTCPKLCFGFSYSSVYFFYH